MTGRGRAGAAGTIINAFATGNGAAFGLALPVDVRVESAPSFQARSNGRRLPSREARLALEAARAVQRRLHAPEPLRIDIRSEIPSKKGLKSSSAVSVAVARATADHARKNLTPQAILESAAEAGLRSRTSLTGAFDDASACLLGGVVLTDNERRRVLRRSTLPPNLVALVQIPAASRATGRLDRKTFRPVAELVEAAWKLALRGRYPDAMLLNTLAYAPLLGHTPLFTLRAVAEGAYAAGLSGKGPAEIALVHRDDLRRFRRLFPTARMLALNRGGKS